MTIPGSVPRTYLTALVAAAVTAVGCSSGSEPDSEPGARDGRGSAVQTAARTQGRCRVTLPNRSVPPYEEPRSGARSGYLGNGRLWTVLWPRGVVVARPDDNVARDGSIGMKFPWWRGVRGKLKVTGRRLDARAPALRADIPSGYGPIGFQSTMLIFPTRGCWKVTGRVGDARLTFVTLVRVKQRRPAAIRPSR